ncbi:mutlidrug resistance protein [Acinetobacter defluvii]|uniref:MFS transporter n=1 Tax=Acinetobacter defluvii TaxID=1871111 RepID=UPI0014907775|nr:MFS transporter [Acinetobacter defluvii]NNP73009.1 mutlidrug resistance protein [Acinetobacter defluvii]
MSVSRFKHRQATSFRFSPQIALFTHTFTLMAFMAASSAPTPLYRLYQQQFNFSPVLLTLIFATYAFTLLTTLLVAGSLSDYIGRKPVIFIALILQATSMGLFLYASNIEMLFLARGFQGIATALATSTFGAALLDLSKTQGTLINSISPMLGMAVGMLLTCLVLTLSSYPLSLVFEVFIALFVVMLCVAWFSPETTVQRSGAFASLKPKLTVPSQTRKALLIVCPVNVALWMVSGFFLSLMPSLLVQTFKNPSVWLNGSMFMTLTIMGAIGILMFRHAQTFKILIVGAMSIAIGASIILLGIHLPQTILLFMGAGITGIGFGTGFMGAIRAVMPLAQPEQRAGLMATFYVISYLAFSIPAIIAGYFVTHIGLSMTATLYICMIIVLSGLAVFFAIQNKSRLS